MPTRPGERGIWWTVAACLFATVAFGFANLVAPLYTYNQNTYYLIGLARAGYGFLADDWLAGTVDPLPVFSAIVELIYTYGHEYLFYVLQVLFCGVYILSLAGIAIETFNIRKRLVEYAVVVAALMAVDSYALGYFSPVFLHFDPRAYVPDTMPGDYFQPSTFGSLLFLSIYCFVRGRRIAALVCLGIVMNVHPVYMLGAGSLALAYMVLSYQESRTLKAPLFLGAIFFLMALPMLLFYAIALRPAVPELWPKTAAIFLERIPHLDPRRWLGSTAFIIRMLVIAAALYLCRRTRLFPILMIPFAVGCLLVGAQLVFDSNTLRQLFSNRMPILLGPVATCCVVGWIADRVFRADFMRAPSTRRAAGVLAAVSMLLLGAFGANGTRWQFEARKEARVAQVLRFVHDSKRRGELYMVPLEWPLQGFRLATGAPLFVDWKSHPRKDSEVLEWYSRIELVRRFYGDPSTIDCSLLPILSGEHRVTHVLTRAKASVSSCSSLRAVHKDANFAVYRIHAQ